MVKSLYISYTLWDRGYRIPRLHGKVRDEMTLMFRCLPSHLALELSAAAAGDEVVPRAGEVLAAPRPKVWTLF